MDTLKNKQNEKVVKEKVREEIVMSRHYTVERNLDFLPDKEWVAGEFEDWTTGRNGEPQYIAEIFKLADGGYRLIAACFCSRLSTVKKVKKLFGSDYTVSVLDCAKQAKLIDCIEGDKNDRVLVVTGGYKE